MYESKQVDYIFLAMYGFSCLHLHLTNKGAFFYIYSQMSLFSKISNKSCTFYIQARMIDSTSEIYK